MTPVDLNAEVAANKRAFAEQRERIRREYAGRYVGFAFGRVVAAAEEFDAVMAAVAGLEPKPLSSAVFAADDEPAFDPIEVRYMELSPE